jgi:hypothetical protein
MAARIFNLPDRRFAIGCAPMTREDRSMLSHPAECNSAIQQIKNLRYVRVFQSKGT